VIFIENLNRTDPCLALAVVNLTQIEYRTLHHPPSSAPPVLHDAPVTMLLAVFDPPIALQIHDGSSW
jgi:hypothetical protein